MAMAQESNLGNGIVTFDAGELGLAIRKISEAGEAYRTAYNNLVSYFDNDLKDAVQGDTLTEFKSCFENRKPQLKAVNDYLDELLITLSSKTNQGSNLADELNSKLHAND